MRGGSKEWKVNVYGTFPQTPGSVILYNNVTFTFDDTIDENANEIYGTLYLRDVIDITVLFKKDNQDETFYHPPSDKPYMIIRDGDVSLQGFKFRSKHDSTAALPPMQMYPLPLMPLHNSTPTAALPPRGSTALPVASLKPYLNTNNRRFESSL